MALPWALARFLPSAVRVRIRSRSTSARPPSTASIKRSVLVPGVGPRLRQRSKLRLGVHDALDDAEQIEGAARQPVDPRHRHHVAGGQLAEHLVKLASVGPRARHLLAVDVAARASGFAKLRKLAVQGLPVSGKAGIADEPFFGVSFGHILR